MEIFGKCDVVVARGGTSGVAAAICAARAGANTLLIERLGVLGGPTTACTRLGYATPSRSFVQFQQVFPTKESLVHRRAGEAIRYPLFQSIIISFRTISE
jgi:flavin-dependent dehydrogenase